MHTNTEANPNTHSVYVCINNHHANRFSLTEVIGKHKLEIGIRKKKVMLKNRQMRTTIRTIIITIFIFKKKK